MHIIIPRLHYKQIAAAFKRHVRSEGHSNAALGLPVDSIWMHVPLTFEANILKWKTLVQNNQVYGNKQRWLALIDTAENPKEEWEEPNIAGDIPEEWAPDANHYVEIPQFDPYQNVIEGGDDDDDDNNYDE